jgi:hypothetical protein
MKRKNYISGNHGLASGISAMLSMHVSIAALMAMTLYNVNKILGYIAWIYTLIIMIGSIHLAWHYAVDGYLALISTTLLWFSIKKVILGLPPKMAFDQYNDNKSNLHDS